MFTVSYIHPDINPVLQTTVTESALMMFISALLSAHCTIISIE